jgi:hypothetical protein
MACGGTALLICKCKYQRKPYLEEHDSYRRHECALRQPYLPLDLQHNVKRAEKAFLAF